jgi:hypothetical protein
MRLIVFEIQLNAFLHNGSLFLATVSLISSCVLATYLNQKYLLFNSESLIFLVGSLYIGALEAVNSSAALSASTPELIPILGDIKLETRFWNRSQSVNFLSGSESFLVVTWSRMWNTISKWSESRISRQWHVRVWYFHGPRYPAHHYFLQVSNELGTVVWRFWNHLHRTIAKVFRPRGLKLYCSKMDV